MQRRGFLAVAAAMLATPALLRAAEPIRLGLTPVFLDNVAEVILRLREALGAGTGRPIDLVQKRTYQEVTGLCPKAGSTPRGSAGFPFSSTNRRFSLWASRSGGVLRFTALI